MAVFFDTGGGDIYGGATREDVVTAMREDVGEDFDESEVFEVSGDTNMKVEGEEGKPDKISTLTDEYTESLGAYCVASDNC